STGGSDQFPFAIQNLNGGHIVGEADLEVTTVGGITANSFATIIDNSTGGVVCLDALVTFSVGAGINLQNHPIFVIFNSDNFSATGGGSIGGDAILNVSAGNINAGSLSAGIFNSGGSIGGAANLTFNLSGDLTTTLGSAEFDVINNNDGSGSGG